MREIKAVYVEDDEIRAKKIAKLLSVSKRLNITPIMAPATLNTEPILRSNPDLVLIDFELTQKQQRTGIMATYRGGTLATSIREERPFIPIVLVTRRTLIQQKYHGAPRQLEPFDSSVFKDEMRTNRDKTVSKLVSLASGYSILKKGIPLTWTSIMKMLKASDADIELLKKCRPGSRLAGEEVPWEPSIVSRWVHDTLFRWPGILYDQLYAATTLGISYDSLSRKAVRKVLSAAEYEGIFDDALDKRWWRSRLLVEAFRVVKKVGMAAPLAKSFGPALKKLSGTQVKPAICLQSGEKYADTVCFVRREPVMYQYTVPYLPDDRPTIMDQARVSLKARRHPDFDRDFLSDESKKILGVL